MVLKLLTHSIIAIVLWTVTVPIAAQNPAEAEPEERVYAVKGEVELKAYIFHPESKTEGPRPAVVVFHGGGWSLGSAEWGFPRARHFAELGLVGVSAQYRISDQKTVTPLDAMADARDVIRWLRANAVELGIDGGRIAAYGWSAGAHLAACSAIFEEGSAAATVDCAPNALILVSPAVSIAHSAWVKHLLLDRATAESISPAEHVRSGLPPTLILQGRSDTVTPTPGVADFCERMRVAGNACELVIYEMVGHLFTPSTEPDNDWPNPDPEVRAAAFDRADAFLRSLKYIP